jgi:site-specific DNA recombinase
MEQSLLFDQFAKGKLISKSKNNNCVIYTRVSSKEQEEGHS